MSNKGMQKLIASGIALLMSLTALFVTAWAILSTEKVGLSVNVSFDPAVTTKVYLATDSSSAVDFKQPNSTVTAENFAKANSALILDTKDGNSLQKDAFELLGADNGLKCDANGEMEFYVFVENYSETESVYYRANINFVGTGEQVAPFSTVTNPSFETAGTALGVESPSISLLIFKILSDSDTGLNANTIQIEIDLSTSFASILGLAQYTSGNYSGLFYIDMGEYPQTQEINTEIISGITGEPDANNYYTSSVNGEKYARRGTDPNYTYYLVEPVRWLVIGNSGTYADFPNKNFDTLGSNQLLLISENLISASTYSVNLNNPLGDTIFNDLEKNKLNKFGNNQYFYSLSKDTEGYPYRIDYYLTVNQSRCSPTAYASSILNLYASDRFWVQSQNYAATLKKYAIHSNMGTYYSSVSETTNILLVRPTIILNF